MPQGQAHDCNRRHYRVVRRNESKGPFGTKPDSYTDFSFLKCLFCGHTWRSKGKYIKDIPDLKWSDKEFNLPRVR